MFFVSSTGKSNSSNGEGRNYRAVYWVLAYPICCIGKVHGFLFFALSNANSGLILNPNIG
jgi:hypothetical protein